MTWGHRPIAALHHSEVARVSGEHTKTRSSGRRTTRPGSRRVRTCHMSTAAARCMATMNVATTGQSYGAARDTSQ